jgi:hypothetical protein
MFEHKSVNKKTVSNIYNGLNGWFGKYAQKFNDLSFALMRYQ